MNIKNYLSALLLMLALAAGSAQATLVTINDGDSFNYDVADTYLFDAVLSASDPTVTFGANVDPGEVFAFTVSAPVETDLLAILTTAPDGMGITMVNPSPTSTVFAGTSFDFPIDGNFFTGQTQWLTISLDGVPGALSYLATLPNGELPVGGFVSSPETNFTFLGGDTAGEGDSGTGGLASQIPTLGPLPLLMIGGVAMAAGRRVRLQANI